MWEFDQIFFPQEDAVCHYKQGAFNFASSTLDTCLHNRHTLLPPPPFLSEAKCLYHSMWKRLNVHIFL
jgi:hypothetical protein